MVFGQADINYQRRRLTPRRPLFFCMNLMSRQLIISLLNDSIDSMVFVRRKLAWVDIKGPISQELYRLWKGLRCLWRYECSWSETFLREGLRLTIGLLLRLHGWETIKKLWSITSLNSYYSSSTFWLGLPRSSTLMRGDTLCLGET